MDFQKEKSNIQVLGKRILVEKERIDCGGLKLTPTLEEDGEKNKGKIIAVGGIGLFNRLRGVKKGAIVLFKKHFTTNHNQDNPLVFVDMDEVVGIIK